MQTTNQKNAETSRKEVAAFISDKPRQYFLYVKLHDPATLPLGFPKERGIVTTWTGDKLGTIYHVGASYYSNFGDWRRSISFRGINGLSYFGTYYFSTGDYARVKAYK